MTARNSTWHHHPEEVDDDDHLEDDDDDDHLENDYDDHHLGEDDVDFDVFDRCGLQKKDYHFLQLLLLNYQIRFS